MITVRKDLLSGTPDEISQKVEELSRGMALHEYMAGTRLRTLAVELARHPALGAQAGPAAVRQLAGDAGFGRFRQVTQTPVNVVLELRP